MIEILVDKAQITKYQKLFVRQLKAVCKEKIACIVGYQGYSDEQNVFYSKEFNFWFTWSESKNRYWNAFGIGKPLKGKNNSIIVEINIPYQGINRNIGGAFALDRKKEVLVLHRGKIGGGRIGIGKELFFENYRDTPITVSDGEIESDFSLIAVLGGKLLGQQVGNFVSEVNRIKHLSKDEASHSLSPRDYSFIDEKAGKSKIKRSGTTVIERTHGIVVNSLARLLEAKGYAIGKDSNRDLFIHKRGRITKMFEIKRSSSPQSLYTAVGQLIIYSIPIQAKIELILVFPEKLKKAVENHLKKLGIEILYYDWNDGNPKFKGLDSMP
jgi:hypothetical protein